MNKQLQRITAHESANGGTAIELLCGHTTWLDAEAATEALRHEEMPCVACQAVSANGEPLERMVLTSVTCTEPYFCCENLKLHPDLNVMLGPEQSFDAFRQRDAFTAAIRGLRQETIKTHRTRVPHPTPYAYGPAVAWGFGDGCHWREVQDDMMMWEAERRQRFIYTQNSTVLDRIPIPRDPEVVRTMFQVCRPAAHEADGTMCVRVENPTIEQMQDLRMKLDVGIQEIHELLMFAGLW